MDRDRERSSGLELMRMLCMLLIVAHHYSVHGGYDVFTADNLSAGVVFVQAVGMFGQAACSAFALISGFYMVERRTDRHYRRIVPLAAEMVFYSLGIWLISLLAGRPLSLADGQRAVFPFLWEYWYVSYYLIFYLLIPFINPFVLGMSKRTFRRLLIIVYVLWTVIPTFAAKSWSFSDLDFFLVMYLTGAYIKLHVHQKVSYDNRWNLAAALAAAALMVLSVVGFAAIGYLLHSDFFVWNTAYFRDYSKLPAVIFAVAAALFTLTAYQRRVRLRTVLALAAVMLPLYVVLTIARSHDVEYLNGIFEMKNASMPIFISQPYIYIANNYENFNCLVKALPAHTHGLRMLFPLWALSGLKFAFPYLVSFPIYIDKEELTTLTLFYDAYYDFGPAGVAVFACALGAAAAWLTGRLERMKNPVGYLFYAQFAIYMALSFFTTWFSNPTTWFYFLVTGAVGFCCYWMG